MIDLGLMRIFTPHHVSRETNKHPPTPMRIVDHKGNLLDELSATGLEQYAGFEIVAVYLSEIGILNPTDQEEVVDRAKKHSLTVCPECICTALRMQYEKSLPIVKDSDLFIDFEDHIFFLRQK